MQQRKTIADWLAEESARPVPSEVQALSDAAIARYPKNTIEAVLYYGSCFRNAELGDGLVDLYLLASDLAAVHPNRFMRLWANAIPPNVYYIETPYGGRKVRAKYALLSLTQFEAKIGAGVRNPYFWARFAQPTGIVLAKNPKRIQAALAQAIATLTAHARALSPEDAEDDVFWTSILRQTYRTELRVEKPNRTRQIFAADAERYGAMRALAPARAISTAPWWWRRLEGRLLSVARLIKAAYTFQGGPDYLVWKIERHSGVKLTLTDWQRRHPILSAWPILWRLWRARTIQ